MKTPAFVGANSGEAELWSNGGEKDIFKRKCADD